MSKLDLNGFYPSVYICNQQHIMKLLVAKNVYWPVWIAITNQKSSKASFLPEYIACSNGRYLNYSMWVRYEFIPNIITDTVPFSKNT